MTGVQTCALPICFPVTIAGGKREGAGRKKIYGEDTVLAQYSVPVSKFEIFDSAATEMLEQWKIKDGDGISDIAILVADYILALLLATK